jgi:hypothetical protein
MEIAQRSPRRGCWQRIALVPLVAGLAACEAPAASEQSQDLVEHTVDELVPFKTDGCSMFPDGTLSDPTRWQLCCLEHDFAYYIGGTRQQRADADAALGACVEEVASATLGNLMWFGVRIGGTPALPTPWRWGFGWRYDPFDGYRDLPFEQLDAAAAGIDAYLASPVEPATFEERAAELADSVGSVPGLGDAVDAVVQEAAALE